MGKSDDQRKLEEITRIVLRPLASPLPLAFFTFGVGSVLQSAFQFGVVPQDEGRNVALIFGGVVFPSMFLAAVFAFLSRDTLGATALGLISFSWLATSLVTYTSAPDPTSAALGVLNLAIAAILLLLGTIGLLGKPVLSAVILLAFCRYGLNGFYELSRPARPRRRPPASSDAPSSPPPSTGAWLWASRTCSTGPSSRSAAAGRRARPSKGE